MLDKEKLEYAQISKYIPFADSIYHLEKLRRRGAYLNSPQTASTLGQISDQVVQLTKSIKQEQELSSELIERAEGTIRGLQSALKSVNDFYYGYDPDFTWWYEKPYKKLDASLTAYVEVIKSKQSKTAFNSSK